ncbi:MAG: DUF2089 domain-containing protein [Dehalococcoidia bacterium]
MYFEKTELRSDSLPRVPGACPVCGRELRVRRLECACGVGLDGTFALGRLQALSPEQLRFAEVFIKNRGKIKDVEQELRISYPTVVSRLNEVIAAMGFAVPTEGDEGAERRRQILDELAEGKITAAEAAQRLRRP